MKILKEFALGILWALLSPLLLALIAIVAVYGIFNFFVQFVLMVIHFFQGKKLFPPFPEDEQAYHILKKSIEEENKKAETPPPAPQGPVYVQANYFTGAPGAYGIPPMPGAQDPRLGAPNPYGIPPAQGQQDPRLAPPNPYALPPSQPQQPTPPPIDYTPKDEEGGDK